LNAPVAWTKGNLRSRAIVDRSRHLLLYVGSRALGYFVMLVAMTYSAELFIAVLVGLTIGHALFNLSSPAGEDMTACCQGGSRGLPPSTMQAYSIGQPAKIPPASPAVAARVRFIVSGMTCGDCVNTVRRVVEVLREVKCLTELSLESGLLEVEFHVASSLQDRLVCIQHVCGAVEGVGFVVSQVCSYRDGNTEVVLAE
jgi:copper chaperone CopZ